MEERGQLSVKVSREERGLNHAKLPRPAGQTVRLNEEQQAAVDRFCEDYETGKRETYLIHGVTGSGKTEVYMELMARVLRDGKQVILLIPEISLTYQTVMRFYRRFGDQIAILNSRLSAGERYDQWERAARGEVSVMIGPRSALFAPFSNLGLILIDEEHEGAYKSETMPRYHAREVAAERAPAFRGFAGLGLSDSFSGIVSAGAEWRICASAPASPGSGGKYPAEGTDR